MSSSTSSSSSSSSSIFAKGSNGGIPIAMQFSGDSDKYIMWRNKFVAWLTSLKIVSVIEKENIVSVSGDEDVRAADDQLRAEQSMRVYLYLVQALPDSVQLLVQHVKTGDAFGVWKIVKAKYERKSTANISKVWSLFYEAKMSAGERIENYAVRIRTAVMVLNGMGEDVSPRCSCST